MTNTHNSNEKKHSDSCPYSKGAYFLDCDCRYFTHNSEVEDTIERFYDKFTIAPNEEERDTPWWNSNGVTPYLVEQWISKELNKAYTAGVASRDAELREAVEGMRKDEVKWKKAKYDVKSIDAVLYNRALDDVLALLTPPTIEKTSNLENV